MTERDQIYLAILRWGLLCTRAAAASGKVAHCVVEADHLHNLPTLIGEANELRHHYYFGKERPLYLERVDRSVPNIDFTLSRYEELWRKLASLRKSP